MGEKKMAEWHCTPNPVVRCTNDFPEKGKQLIRQFGFIFDEKWFYWIPPKNQNIVKKAPIWCYPHKGVAAEKRRPYTKGRQSELKPLWL